jgi:VanW like protein
MSIASTLAVPSRWENLIFLAKTKVLQVIRSWQNIWNPELRKWPRAKEASNFPLGAESISDLWVGATEAEWVLQAGKIHNLRQALKHIDGIEIPAGGMFSFWAQVGLPITMRGFTLGRELREGCIIPAVGGGLCQLSNALYDGALKAGLEIVERHAHNQVIPGSLAEINRDATVFWNYVDLRFRVTSPLRIEAIMNDKTLTIRLRTQQTLEMAPPEVALTVAHANSCLACGITSCFRQQQPRVLTGRTAYLVDDYWPEFDRYIQANRTEQDVLLLPVNGQQVKKANYAWNIGGFHQVSQHRSILLLRAAQSILLRIVRQGAKYQQLLMGQSRYLAKIYGQSLTPDTTHLVVTQSLLPHLWQAGHLRGRSFDVLMTALPMEKIQARLDEAAAKHPQSPTLNNFRVSPEMAMWETAALKQARQILTTHQELGLLWPNKTQILDWVMPIVSTIPAVRVTGKPVLVLPSASLGRRGIYELRAALSGLEVHLIVAGGELEVPGFWDGYDMEYLPNYEQALMQATIVVSPAWIEHQPRRVLLSIATGIPTIVSKTCGLSDMPELIQVPVGDVAALRSAIKLAINAPIDKKMEAV